MRLVISLLLGLALAGCDRQKAETPQGGGAAADEAAAEQEAAPGVLDRSHAGAPAPSIRFQDPNGEPATFDDFKGKPLLVNLWATWCAPCIAEMPTLDALAARSDNIRVLALSQDVGGPEKVADFFAKRQFAKLQPYLDPEMAMMMTLKLGTLPTTILYDADGKEVWRLIGIEDWNGERAAQLLAEANRD